MGRRRVGRGCADRFGVRELGQQLRSLGNTPATQGSSPAAASAGGTTLTAKTIGGKQVLVNAQGFTLYWFAPDTATHPSAPDPARPTGRRSRARPLPGPASPARWAPSPGRTARRRPPTTGTRCTPTPRTPPPDRTRATGSTSPAGCGTTFRSLATRRLRPLPRPSPAAAATGINTLPGTVPTRSARYSTAPKSAHGRTGATQPGIMQGGPGRPA